MPFDPDQYLSETKITHDGIFKEFFKQVIFCKELYSVLLSAEEYRQFDWSTLRIEASEQTSATSRLRVPDLVTTVQLDGHPETLELACILDHKSEAGTKVLHQLNEYAAIMIRQRQTAVMPIVIYNGQSPHWNGPIRLHQAVPGMGGRLGEMFGNHVPDFELRVVNLRDEETLRRAAGLRIESVLYSMGRIWDANEKVLGQLFRLGEAMSVDDRNQIIPKMINYFYNYNRSITMEAVMDIEKRVVRDEDDRIMQRNVYIWDVIRQESEKKGKLEGLQEGKLEGLQEGKLEGLQEGKLEGLQEGKLEGLQEGKLKGLQEGERRSRQTVCEIAGRLIQDGKSNSEIQRYTNLSLDEIRRLRNSS